MRVRRRALNMPELASSSSLKYWVLMRGWSRPRLAIWASRAQRSSWVYWRWRAMRLAKSTWWASNQVGQFFQETAVEQPGTWRPNTAELTVAVSPVMAPIFQELADKFNARVAEKASKAAGA